MNSISEIHTIKKTEVDTMELILIREQTLNFEDSLSNYFNQDKKAPLADCHYQNDDNFIEGIAQF